MKGLVAAALAALAAPALCAVAPKVGATVALRSGYGPQQYISNAAFKSRPIVEEMDKCGVDLCWYEGWKKDDALKSLKQFNCVWLIIDHEDRCPYPAAETAAALRKYVEAGGGLVISHSTGRYPEAPVDAYWREVYAAFGLGLLHEEIVDPTTSRSEDKYYDMFFTDSFADHPVTKEVPGLWLPMRRTVPTWGVVATRPSKEWTAVVTAGPGGRSHPRDPITNAIQSDKPGTYAPGSKPPIVLVRTLGKGRIVFEAIHKDSCGWVYNVDRWPNLVERSEIDGRRSDAVKLLENAFKWASEPSEGDAGFTRHYKPVEPDAPPYSRSEQFGKRWEEKRAWKPFAAAPFKNGAVGVVGVHSAHSDGESTVAEYVAEAKRLGLSFLVFTDPLAKSSPEKLEALRADCAAQSKDGFYCCPGVEYVDSDGYEWMTFSDKASWPQKEIVRDGVAYQLFDGKVMLQPTVYRGRNLYRGGLLNMKRLGERGAFDVNLLWVNQVVPVAYDVDKPMFDNFPEFLASPESARCAATVPYTRVRKASDLAAASSAAVLVCDDVDSARKLANAEGSGANRVADQFHAWVRLGRGIEIKAFDFVRVPGTDVMQCVVAASSPAGLREICVHDGQRRTIARFDAAGERDFSRTFTFEFDAQSYPQVVATDKAGARAVSVAKWLNNYHAGLHRCGDNANLLAINPKIVMYMNWDSMLAPAYRNLSRLPKHSHISEAYFWEKFGNNPSREPSVGFRALWNTLRLEGIDYPNKGEMPSSRTTFPLVQPNVVTVIDQLQGEYSVEPRHAQYMTAPVQGKVGENPHWRLRHRTYQFCDRVDGWWRAVYYENAPDYRGGYTVVEGELEFLHDAIIAAPLSILQFSTRNPKGKVSVMRGGNAAKFGKGSWHGVCGSEREWYGIFGLDGCDDACIAERRIDNGVETTLQVGEKGRKVKAGEKLRYRVAIGSFIEPPHGTQYCEWFMSMMDGSGFMHDEVKGRVAGVSGILDLEAKKGEASVTLGPTWFIQNYPVRVKGLVDNGSAYWTDGDKVVKPLAFLDGLAYAEVPLEKRKTWRFMNFFAAKSPALRFSYVPAMPGHEKATLQISNSSGKPVSDVVYNLKDGGSFKVNVPAGGMVVRDLGL